jgi:HTH-type transcriptional regulator/antitoxin HipB
MQDERIIRLTSDLGHAIRLRRKSLRYTQGDVAEFNGCSIRFISELERGVAGANLRQTIRVVNSLGMDLVVRERGDGTWS